MQAGTGTWDGPAPRGAGPAALREQPASSAPVHEPESVRLSNGALMPIIGFGTLQVLKPGIVRCAEEGRMLRRGRQLWAVCELLPHKAGVK